jgi:predicted RND superfamily exporter protein
VDYFQQLTADLQDAGQARLRPILLTTFTTVLGLLPMAMDHGNGAELWRPMAITTIGGLLSSTILSMIVLPTLIYTVERFTEPSPRPSPAAGPAAPWGEGEKLGLSADTDSQNFAPFQMDAPSPLAGEGRGEGPLSHR